MPSRRILPVRRNRAMPESPKIVKAVTEALGSSRTGESKHIFIPWEDFVFSNVELPPSSLIRKGLEIITTQGPKRDWLSAHNPITKDSRVTKKGVWLITMRQAGTSRGGSMTAGMLVLSAAMNEITIRHEVTHFVQMMGENLIMLAKGDPNAFTIDWVVKRHDKMAKKYGLKSASQVPYGEDSEGLWTLQYGAPKRRSLTWGKGGANMYGDSSSHALHDVEFMTDALNVGLEAAGKFLDHLGLEGSSSRSQTEETYRSYHSKLFALVNTSAWAYMRQFTQDRKRDFVRTAYHGAAREVNAQKGRNWKPLESSLGKVFEKKLITAAEFQDYDRYYGFKFKELQEAGDAERHAEMRSTKAKFKEIRFRKYHLSPDAKRAESQRRSREQKREAPRPTPTPAPEPRPTRRPAPAPTPRPSGRAEPRPRPAPLPTPAPAPRPAPPVQGRRQAGKVSAKLTYRHEMNGNRMAYVIYGADQKQTGKYFFSQEKAQAYIAKISRAG